MKTTRTLINRTLISHLSLFGIFVLFLSYLYFVNITTFNASNIQTINDQTIQIQTEISKLESEFINKNRMISEIDYKEYGLSYEIDNSKTIFVNRDNAKRLTFNE